ncbi:uncharacterized protein LOC124280718 [Haliotis rubra]|nr:uncharacterized protein LOC124280718 [Haliotis rubra]
MTYIVNKYGGSALRRKYFNKKTEVKDTCSVKQHHPEAEGLESDSCSSQLYDPKWCVSPGSLWWEVAGDAWSRGEGVPNDPLYGIPPWMEAGGRDESEDESLSWDEEFNIPAGALWADICPVVDLVSEAPY